MCLTWLSVGTVFSYWSEKFIFCNIFIELNWSELFNILEVEISNLSIKCVINAVTETELNWKQKRCFLQSEQL